MKLKTGLLSILFVLTSSTSYSADTCQSCFDKGRVASVTLFERIGATEEHQLRKGNVAAHIFLDSTVDPYLFFAFPNGNSGVALWFKSSGGTARLKTQGHPNTISGKDGLTGAEIELRSGTTNLSIDDTVLGSMRFIRDRELAQPVPPEVRTETATLADGRLIIERLSINKLVKYRIEIEPIDDTRISNLNGKFELVSSSEVRFRIRGLGSEKPLTALSPSEVFKPEALAKMNPKQVEAFSFLLTKEKMMAGSPRYLSKFGRDSLVTLNVLMEAMKPEAIENVLSALLSSSHPTEGLISHEQSEGDFASFERLKKHEKVDGVTTPLEDYKMIDADFMFTIAMGEYLKRYPERAKSFLNGKDQRGIELRELVQNNFRHTMHAAEPFAKNPEFRNLVRLRKGESVGNWRDSENGLGGGVYPFDVNAALVPGAIAALREVYNQSGSEFFDRKRATELGRVFEVWSTKVTPLFEVRMKAKDVATLGERYLRTLGIDPRKLSPAPKEDLVFPGVSLDESGKPVPIMHSDDSMLLVFGTPSNEFLRSSAQRIRRSFPYGLSTTEGILVANPAFAKPELQKKFDETKYHGRVSWTMQEHLLVFGLSRALGDSKLPADLAKDLTIAKQHVQDVIAKKAKMSGNEVFALKFENGTFVAVPFAGDAKSNSNQLWSHLSLAEQASQSRHDSLPLPRASGDR